MILGIGGWVGDELNGVAKVLEGGDFVGDRELVFVDLVVGRLQEAKAKALWGFHGPELFAVDGRLGAFNEVVGVASLEGLGNGVGQGGCSVNSCCIEGQGNGFRSDQWSGAVVNGDDGTVGREGCDSVGDRIPAAQFRHRRG